MVNIEELKILLNNEAEKVCKLKAIVIKEKKKNALLTEEVERLKLELAKHETVKNCSILVEQSTQSDTFDLPSSLHLNLLVSELISMVSSLKNKLDTSTLQTNEKDSIINTVKAELDWLYCVSITDSVSTPLLLQPSCSCTTKSTVSGSNYCPNHNTLKANTLYRFLSTPILHGKLTRDLFCDILRHSRSASLHTTCKNTFKLERTIKCSRSLSNCGTIGPTHPSSANEYQSVLQLCNKSNSCCDQITQSTTRQYENKSVQTDLGLDPVCQTGLDTSDSNFYPTGISYSCGEYIVNDENGSKLRNSEGALLKVGDVHVSAPMDLQFLIPLVTTYSNFCSALMRRYHDFNFTRLQSDISKNWCSVSATLSTAKFVYSSDNLKIVLDEFLKDLERNFTDSFTHRGDFAFQTARSIDSLCVNSGSTEIFDLSNRLKDVEEALTLANNRVFVAENDASNSRQKLRVCEEKMQRMKTLLVKMKLDISEQQKKICELSEKESSLSKAANELQQDYSRVISEKMEVESKLFALQNEKVSVREERDLALDRLHKLQNEFSAYKVKALRALKSTEGNDLTIISEKATTSKYRDSCLVDPSNSDLLKEIQLLKDCISELRQRTAEADLQVSFTQAECNVLRSELADQKFKHNELIKSSRLEKQMNDVQLANTIQEHKRALDKLEQSRTQERNENELLIHQLNVQHQLELSEERQQWQNKLMKLNLENESLSNKLIRLERNSNPPENCSSKRSQGDGAEHDLYTNNVTVTGSDCESRDSHDSINHKVNSRAPIPTLEQLLNNSGQRLSHFTNLPSIGSPSSPISSVDFNQHLNQPSGLFSSTSKQQRRIEYLSELLCESEANVVRLIEQNKFLKEEIRRLEQVTSSNHSNVPSIPTPEQHLPLEHLKNVLLKTLSLPRESAERGQLIKVLIKLLVLNSDEINLLESALNVTISSWGSYFTVLGNSHM